jgi:hypothetical protein
MTIYKNWVIKSVFSVLILAGTLALAACNKSAPDKSADQPQASAPKDLVVAKPDASGKLKCPNGDDAIHITGPCPGAWHFEKKAGAKNSCQFVYETSVTCKKKGYAENGREACYGGAYTVEADAKISSDADCKAKFNAVSNANYEFDCCK